MTDSGPEPSNRAEIARSDLGLSLPKEAIITDVKHLASYNWIEAPTPTITVPGSPRCWAPPKKSTRVKKDTGLVYIAQNAFRHPESPLEPLFRALYVENPSFNINAVDLVTDRNNVRKLLSFVSPSFSRNGLDPFTIKVELAGKTAIFCRQETATHEVIGPADFRGFGHEFEKTFTTNEVNESTGHHRIVSYKFGGLIFLVRHETDGYVADSRPSQILATADDLLNKLGALSLSSNTSSTHITFESSKLTVKKGGMAVPLESTLEIKTRVSHKPLGMPEIAPQLWVSQTPNLVRAYHSRGVFAPPVLEDVTSEIKVWEEQHQPELKKLVVLIKRILLVMREWGGDATIRYDPLQDKLVILPTPKTVERKMLPGDLYSRWKMASTDEDQSVKQNPPEAKDSTTVDEGRVLNELQPQSR